MTGILAAVAISHLPTILSVLRAAGQMGWGQVAVADLASRSAVVLIASLALWGVLSRRYWSDWISKGVAVVAVMTAGAHVVTSGHARPTDALWFAAGAFLIILSHDSRRREGASTAALADRLRGGLRGWALAFNLGAVPLVLATLTPTVANEVTLPFGAAAAAIVVVVVLLVIGSWLLATQRRSGFLLCIMADLSGLALFRELFLSSWAGHPALLILFPALLVVIVATAADLLSRASFLSRQRVDLV